LYTAPLDFHDDGLGELVALASGLRDGVPASAVTGQTSLRLADLVFEVRSNAPTGLNENVLNLTANTMINQGAFTYLTDEPAPAIDLREGNHSNAVLQVDQVNVVGLFAFAAVAELANTAVLDGVEVQSAISAFELFNRAASTPAAAAAASFNCSVGIATNVLSLGGQTSCLVRISSSNRDGVASLAVSVHSTRGGGNTEVPLRVWYPSQVELFAEDTELNQINSTNAGEGCALPLYQSTALTAVASFGGSGLPSVTRVDVSQLVSFSASASVVLVSGDVATGAAAGSTIITLPQASTTVVPVTISVSDVLVAVVELRGIVITGVEFGQQPLSSVPWEPVGTQLNASVRLVQRLLQEGATGEVHAIARYSDGAEYTLSQDE
ncbi:MAG: hypothetical protein ACO32I_09325, partial [Candidatus Limnocylindrus sp.]